MDNGAYKSVPANEKNEAMQEKWRRIVRAAALQQSHIVTNPPVCEAPKGFGVRHTQALILFISLSVGYAMRAQLSVSLVAMTSASTPKHLNCNPIKSLNFSELNNTEGAIEINDEFLLKNKSIVYNDLNKSLDRTWSVHRTYDWNKATQEMIMFSFFVGYTSMMMPMGLLAQKFGGKIPILIALGANGVLSILTPWLPIFGGWITLCVCRLLQGMTQAAFYPSIHTVLGKWAPINERGRLSTYIYAGSQFGTIVAFQIAGVFAGSPSLGWPSTFWLCGVASLACFGLLLKFGAATPHEHPRISSEELSYIMGDGSIDVVPKKRRTPWKHIITSKAVWGLVITHAGSAMGYLFVLTQIPLYMNKILGVNIKMNGVYSSLPYIAMYFMTLLFGFLSDYCRNKKYMSVANIRRAANSIGMVASPLFLIGFSYVSSTLMGVTLLVVCLGLHSGVHVGFHINHIDLAPNFAGPIMALGNMIANLSSLLVPVLVANIVKDDVVDQNKWQIVFIIIAAIQITTNAIFVVLVKGKVQVWNFYDEGDENKGSAEDETYALKEKNSVIIKTDINK